MLSHKGVGAQDIQLNTYDYLADIPGNSNSQKMVEVQFKNTRKGYYLNSSNIPLEKGDIVAVEAQPGHDIGRVTLTGQLVPLQMKKANLRNDSEIQRIYRIAKPNDIEKYDAAKEKEHDTMIRSRKIAKSLLLEMKIGDVEYQGDGNKAIFYYIADGRVDFRQLIRVLADTFRIRIEMKQIGARQEAGRIGGIGPCGRELCCATWMTTFVSVSTNAARFQDISLNPQRLAGQCAKLKCCLNYEVNSYVEAQKRLPSKQIDLHTQDATYYFFKVDILTNMITYSTDPRVPANLITISSARAFEIINLNKANKNPIQLQDDNFVVPTKQSSDLLDETDLTRFDKKGNARGGNNRRPSRGPSRNPNKGPRNFSKDNASGDNNPGDNTRDKPRSRPTNRRINKTDTDKPVGTRRDGEQPRENNKRPNSRQNNNTTNKPKGERAPRPQGTRPENIRTRAPKPQAPRTQSPSSEVPKPQAPQKSE
ncbi:MAG: regulatory iron-sulfur-containing complex subunit RicT [Bacteroidaceae bacterium]